MGEIVSGALINADLVGTTKQKYLFPMLSNNNEFIWDKPLKKAFQDWKKVLASQPVLKVCDLSSQL